MSTVQLLIMIARYFCSSVMGPETRLTFRPHLKKSWTHLSMFHTEVTNFKIRIYFCVIVFEIDNSAILKCLWQLILARVKILGHLLPTNGI